MDPSVLAAIARWPNVPAVAGWLSLDSAGRWRLHPQGDAAQGGPGEPISNPGILAFIGRNYDHDDQGRWFFQNGPQRVFVRLDAAPFILRTGADATTLETHTGVSVKDVSAWYLDDAHRLYAQTDAGPGMIAGRDMPALMDSMINAMQVENSDDALEALIDLGEGQTLRICHPLSRAATPLRRLPRNALERELHFVPNPVVEDKPAARPPPGARASR